MKRGRHKPNKGRSNWPQGNQGLALIRSLPPIGPVIQPYLSVMSKLAVSHQTTELFIQPNSSGLNRLAPFQQTVSVKPSSNSLVRKGQHNRRSSGVAATRGRHYQRVGTKLGTLVNSGVGGDGNNEVTTATSEEVPRILTLHKLVMERLDVTENQKFGANLSTSELQPAHYT